MTDNHIFDQIEAIQTAPSLIKLVDIVESNIQALGFEYFSYGHRAHTPVAAPKLELINNYPSAWSAKYQEESYFEQDPTILHALKTTAPLVWTEDTFSQSTKLKEDAASFGIEFGWSQATRSTSGVSMLTLVRPSTPLSDNEIRSNTPNLMWFTQTLNEALEKFIIESPLTAPEVSLTNREAEVIRWTADGKTSYDISVILGIAERTVNFHLNNVMVKLNSHNKISATVKAMVLCLI
ncbi:MAG: autoinducer binding domain-containing protein [Colwellia sp.]|jgi:DNA-binding HTH domain-containing proteins